MNSIRYIQQDLYDRILYSIPIACVDIAIIRDNEVLLVKRKDAPAKDQWWVPGGRVLKGEMMRDTAKRKAFEEVGMEVTVGPIIHTAETIFEDGPNGIPVHSINSCFILFPKDNIIKLDSHSLDFKWVKNIDPNLHPYVKDCLKAVGL